jgi:hypothetical protein
VTGAAFTTTKPTGTDAAGVADGPDHCQNGNEQVNCNIYDGKKYVWLNGGPTAASLGNGTYFFAVLAPSGQPAPNDGGTNQANGPSANLSDDHHTYKARKFSVSGGNITNLGTHDFANNKIRLMPYADTPNKGGAYIMAICSLDKGYPVTPSRCKYDAFKVRDSNDPPPAVAAAPTVTKGAEGAFDNTYTWTIGKLVDKTLVRQNGGTSATFTYTVTATRDNGAISGVKVSGTISVFNPNSGDITGFDITDELSNGTACAVAGGSDATLRPGKQQFSLLMQPECDSDGATRQRCDDEVGPPIA